MSFTFARLRTINEVIIEFQLVEGHVHVDVSGVGQVSQASFVRENQLICVVAFVRARSPSHVKLAEFDLVHQILVRVKLVLAHGVLRHDVNLYGAILGDHILNLVLYKPIERFFLLRNQAVLFEK